MYDNSNHRNYDEDPKEQVYEQQCMEEQQYMQSQVYKVTPQKRVLFEFPIQVPLNFLQFFGICFLLSLVALFVPLITQGVLNITPFLIVLVVLPLLGTFLWVVKFIEFKSFLEDFPSD